MPATHRDFPYIRTVWLPELLTSERSCEWAVWFQANFQNWDRVPSDCDQTQNACRLRGHNPVLTGQPNLIIPSGENVRVVDVKDGADIMVYTCAPLRACHSAKRPASPARSTTQKGYISSARAALPKIASDGCPHRHTAPHRVDPYHASPA